MKKTFYCLAFIATAFILFACSGARSKKEQPKPFTLVGTTWAGEQVVDKGAKDEATASMSITFTSATEATVTVALVYKDPELAKKAGGKGTIKTTYTYTNQTLTLKKLEEKENVIFKVDESAKTMTSGSIGSGETITLKLVK